jgi:hypothetical protein
VSVLVSIIPTRNSHVAHGRLDPPSGIEMLTSFGAALEGTGVLLNTTPFVQTVLRCHRSR